MKHNKSRQLAWISLTLAGALFLQDALPASASGAASFENLISGENARAERKPESEYSRISISTEEDLASLALDCQLDAWSRDKYVVLENDIVLKENCGLSIPSFGGIFDGGGYTVSGLELTAEGSAWGLFRYVQEGGVVRNLSVSGTVAPGGSKSQLGILAGLNYGRIENCQVSGRVTGARETGGIAGVNEASGEIRNCQSAAFVTGDHCAGGICGSNLGTLNNCRNSGSVNTHSTEVSYSIEDITMEEIEDINSAERVAVHTDTGGIAGYSEGKIYYCANSGTVGYQHVGYNTGGIVGRLHQGYLQNCTNTGRVLGRKDVGGIAGQLEPFLEIQYLNDKLGELDRETAVFFDLLEAAHEDISSYGSQAAELSKSISGHLTNASAAGSGLTGAANDLWYIYNQELTGINNDLSRLNGEWREQAEKDQKHEAEAAGINPTSEEVPGNAQTGQESADSDVGEDFDKIDIDKADIENLGKDMESYLAALRRFGESVNVHLSNVTTATNDRSGGINGNLQTLNRELEAAGSEMGRLADILQQGGSQTSADVDALVAQARVVRRCINDLRDDLFRYEGISVEDASDEAASGSLENLGAEQQGEAYYDTSAFQQGKITLCINQGTVEADTNVGGITGLIATEYDFDPEDDIALTGEESFRIEQSVKAVVRESRNLGAVTGKKDYVGGVVGKADFGAVVSCESYGQVESTGGSYVGGIAGSSDYCIRSCFCLGALSGKTYVGGIAGRGCDIFYSYAYPEICCAGERAGSIAGWVQPEGILYGNYYVQGNVPGVDSIGYAAGAAPLSYDEFCSMEGVPEAFREFTVSFQADGRELAAFKCPYGGGIDLSQVPAVPEKEGYYGVWPKFDYGYVTGNRVLEAQYERWITSLASEERDESGRAKVLVQGEFLPESILKLEELEGGTRLSVLMDGEEDTHASGENLLYKENLLVRVLCDDPERTNVEIQAENGYAAVQSAVVGSYLEFSMEAGGTFRLAAAEKDSRNLVIAICGGSCAALIIILVLVIQKMRKRRRKNPTERER